MAPGVQTYRARRPVTPQARCLCYERFGLVGKIRPWIARPYTGTARATRDGCAIRRDDDETYLVIRRDVVVGRASAGGVADDEILIACDLNASPGKAGNSNVVSFDPIPLAACDNARAIVRA